jgi:CheY-like chemotaxis protein
LPVPEPIVPARAKSRVIVGTLCMLSRQVGHPKWSIRPSGIEGAQLAGTVLCVDDDRNLCQILAKALGDEGYAVLTAFDGDEAVAMVEKTKPDLILLDLILPRRDGFEVVEAIRSLESPLSDSRVVILSGCSPTPAYRERAAALGIEAFLTKPMALAQLLETVGSICEPEKSNGAAAVRSESATDSAATRQRASSALKGSLRRVPFPAVLHHLHGLRATGVLHLESGKKRKWIELRDGHPVAIRSNLVNECLGHHLLRSGHIKQCDLDESRRRMRTGQLQGEILVAMEVLTEEEIATALQAQADEKLFEVFAWKAGKFRFEKESSLESGNTIRVKRSPANLILHGVRTRFAGDRIGAFFQSSAECVVVRSESPYYRFQDVDLEPEHAALLQKLNGNRRVSEILARDPDGSLARTLYALVATGLLELQGGPSPDSPTNISLPADGGAQAEAEDDDERSSLNAMADRFSAQTYFEILGIDSNAEAPAVEAAYVKLAESSHPDRFADSTEAVRQVAEEVFAHISRAYETLRDPRSRAQYLLDVRRERRAAASEEKGQKALEAANQFQRGMALLNARSYEDALARFGQALELNPDEGDYHTHYGWTLHLCHPSSSSVIEEAIEHVRRGIKLASHADRAYLFMGRLLRAIGKPAAAERMFTRAVQIAPDCVEALRELRLINMRRERSKGLIRRMLRR